MNRNHAVLAAILLGAGGFWWFTSGRNGPSSGSHHLPQPESLALLIGIDRFEQPAAGRVPPLSGATNDVARVQQMLVQRGFQAANIRTLTNEQATHEAIVRAFDEHLLRRATAETRVVVWYSGHGSLVPDASKAERAVSEDQAEDNSVLAYDSRRGDRDGRYDVTDDELFSLMRALTERTTNVLLVTDACHSAGLTRGAAAAGPAVRTVSGGLSPQDRQMLEPFWPKDVPFHDDTETTGLGSIQFVHIAACGDDQEAGEVLLEDDRCLGTLTHYLCDVLERAEGPTSWRRVVERARALVAGSGNRPDQVVSATGPLDRAVFGGTMLPPLRGFRVDQDHKGNIRLHAGHAHEVWEGTQFLLVDQDGKTVATARATYCDMTWSWLELAEGAAVAWGQPLRAVVHKMPAENGLEPLRVEVSPDAGVALPTDLLWATAISQQATHRLVRQGTELWLTDHDGNWIRTVQPTPDALAEAFLREWRHRRLWEATCRTGDHAVRLTAGAADEQTVALGREEQLPCATMLRNDADGGLLTVRAPVLTSSHGGGLVTLTLQNQSDRALYATVLSVTEARSVSVVWPDASAKDRQLKPGEQVPIPVLVGPPPHWPADRPMVDRYLVIATQEPLDMQEYVTEAPEPAAKRGNARSAPPFLALGTTRGEQEATQWGVAHCDVHVLRAKD